MICNFFKLVMVIPLVRGMFSLPMKRDKLTKDVMLTVVTLPAVVAIARSTVHGYPHTVHRTDLTLKTSR